MLKLLDLRGRTSAGPSESVADLRRTFAAHRASPERPVNEVRTIIEQVRAGGDTTLRELTARYDEVQIDAVRVPSTALDAALRSIDPLLREALEESAAAVGNFHRATKPNAPRVDRDGISVRQIRRAVDRVGCYVPGGHATYPSSVLMTAVPARIAGVGRVVMCVPPGPDGDVAASVLAAAAIAEVDEVYCIGGAQAIAALAYGTETVVGVDMIVGTGNQYVAEAKRQVLVDGVVGVAATYSGPSEVAVIADETTPPELAAIDLIVQAEHGPDGNAWLVTWVPEIAERIIESLGTIAARAERHYAVVSSLQAGGHCVIVDDARHATEVVNAIAPEQLQLMTIDPEVLLPGIKNAGAVFMGTNAPAAVGDYIAGPSHVLPVGGSARFASALRVEDFMCTQHVISVDEATLGRISSHICAIAKIEGLDAHARAVTMRSRT